VGVYPFIEGWITGDQREHHMTQRPRNAPRRTAIGAAGVTFYAVLWSAASSDLIATHFKLSIEGVTHAIQALLFIGPVVAYIVAHRICIGLQKKDREIALHGFESARIVRLPGGEYIEVHEQLSDYERWKLVDFDDYKPLMLRPNKNGRIPVTQRVRSVLSNWFFEDRIAPVTKSEIEAARHGGHH
jgi:ubiquinol-cytochrome c reductase cytochrome b subunit